MLKRAVVAVLLLQTIPVFSVEVINNTSRKIHFFPLTFHDRCPRLFPSNRFNQEKVPDEMLKPGDKDKKFIAQKCEVSLAF
jgi:hypothetical protein